MGGRKVSLRVCGGGDRSGLILGGVSKGRVVSVEFGGKRF